MTEKYSDMPWLTRIISALALHKTKYFTGYIPKPNYIQSGVYIICTIDYVQQLNTPSKTSHCAFRTLVKSVEYLLNHCLTEQLAFKSVVIYFYQCNNHAALAEMHENFTGWKRDCDANYCHNDNITQVSTQFTILFNEWPFCMI